MINNKKFNPVATELFIRGRNLGISISISTILFCSTEKC